MSPETRRVFAEWPRYWVEWDVALDLVASRLSKPRRSIANRAAWLVHHDRILREWMDNRAFGGSTALLTRRE